MTKNKKGIENAIKSQLKLSKINDSKTIKVPDSTKSITKFI